MDHHDIELMFSAEVGPNVFDATMSQKRMKFLLPGLSFDDKEQREVGQLINSQQHVTFLKHLTKTVQSTSYHLSFSQLKKQFP